MTGAVGSRAQDAGGADTGAGRPVHYYLAVIVSKLLKLSVPQFLQL